MGSSWGLLLFVALLGLAGSAFYAGAEIGLLRLDALRVRSTEEQRSWSNRILARLLDRRQPLIITTIIGNNLFLVGTSVVLTGLAVRRWGEGAAFPVAAILTVLFFVFSEVLPKAFYRRYPYALMAVSAFPLLATHMILRPITALALLAAAAVNAPFRKGHAPGLLVSREELRRLLDETTEEETEGIEAPMIARVLHLRSRSARQVMIPLRNVVMVPETASVETVLEAIRGGGPTRIPMHGATRGQVIGLINVFDILFDLEPKPDARHYLRPVEFVPASRRIDELLTTLRRTRSGMAMVTDSTRRAIGLVTTENLVEEIVGDLADEHEAPAARVPGSRPPSPPGITPEGSVSGTA